MNSITVRGFSTKKAGGRMLTTVIFIFSYKKLIYSPSNIYRWRIYAAVNLDNFELTVFWWGFFGFFTYYFFYLLVLTIAVLASRKKRFRKKGCILIQFFFCIPINPVNTTFSENSQITRKFSAFLFFFLNLLSILWNNFTKCLAKNE